MIVGGLFGGLRHRLTGRGTADNGEAAVGCFCFWTGYSASGRFDSGEPALVLHDFIYT